MDLEEKTYLERIANSLESLGTTIEPLEVTESGTYQEEGKAYSPVTVDFPTFYTTNIVNNSDSDVTVFYPEEYTISGVKRYASRSKTIKAGETEELPCLALTFIYRVTTTSGVALSFSLNKTGDLYMYYCDAGVKSSRQTYLIYVQTSAAPNTLTITNA